MARRYFNMLLDYKILPKFHALGIRLALTPAGGILPDPQDVLTEELKDVLRNHRDAAISEIRTWNDTEQTIMYVATDLTSFTDADARYGLEIGHGPTYRQLDAAYYAWLRAQMEKVKGAKDAGRISAEKYNITRDRFMVVHDWALANLGEPAIVGAMKDMATIHSYIPPSDKTREAYQQVINKARREVSESKKGQIVQTAPTQINPQVEPFQTLLSTRGYAVLRTPHYADNVVIARDKAAKSHVPRKLYSLPVFTVAEALSFCGATGAEINTICGVRAVFKESEIILPGTQQDCLRHIGYWRYGG
jgi:hypothetical protein